MDNKHFVISSDLALYPKRSRYPYLDYYSFHYCGLRNPFRTYSRKFQGGGPGLPRQDASRMRAITVCRYPV